MSGRPKVMLGMPRYGDVSPGAALGWMLATNGEGLELLPPVNACTSATPHCFNILLAQALNLRDDGKVTHFAMIHSDVEPVMPDDPKALRWLDVLMAEMNDYHLDVISVVIPIKDQSPPFRTSTAIGKRDMHWPPARYINAEDRANLPRTILPSDVCGADEVLLINSGLLLMDLRSAQLWDGFAFEYRTALGKTPAGRHVPIFLPEDWLMSRHVQEKGGRLAATWKVPAKHHGVDYWPNFDEDGPA